MKKYYTFLGYIISIDFPIILSLISLKQHIPEISETLPQKEDISISFIIDTNEKIMYDLHHLIIHSIYNETWAIDMPHLIYSYLKYVFFHKNIYFVHSCLIEKQLFIGASGAGKTTLCIDAIKEELVISSFDRTCIIFKDNLLIALAGTDIVSVRTEMIQPSLTLLHSSTERNLYQYDTVKQPQNIQSISLFQLHEGFKRKTIEGISVVHQLYSFFIDIVKSDCFMQNGNLLFSPTYCESKKKDLFNALHNILTPVYFVSGNVESIVLFIKNN